MGNEKRTESLPIKQLKVEMEGETEERPGERKTTPSTMPFPTKDILILFAVKYHLSSKHGKMKTS